MKKILKYKNEKAMATIKFYENKVSGNEPHTVQVRGLTTKYYMPHSFNEENLEDAVMKAEEDFHRHIDLFTPLKKPLEDLGYKDSDSSELGTGYSE